MDLPKDRPILLFDGVCNLCNDSVQFIIRADKHERFLFAALQSDTGKAILQKEGLEHLDLSTAVLYDNGCVYLKSDVGLQTAKRLPGIWPVLYLFSFLPRFIRDNIYDWIAANRYNWFGKKDQCMVPTAALNARFLS